VNRTILLLSDGYTEADRERFQTHAAAVTLAILTTEPFASEPITVETRFIASNERTATGEQRDTRYGVRVTVDGTRTTLSQGANTVQRVTEDRGDARWVVVLVNTARSGGRLLSSFVVAGGGHANAPNTVLHELGHLIGGLPDEYGLHDRQYPDQQHPAPNFSTVGQPVKWQHLIDAGLLGPPVLGAGPWANVYRPARRTKMMNSPDPFSPVDVLAIRRGLREGRVDGDANCDGRVDFADLNAVLSDFGKVGTNLLGDLNGDGRVNMADLNIVLSNFGDAGDEHGDK